MPNEFRSRPAVTQTYPIKVKYDHPENYSWQMLSLHQDDFRAISGRTSVQGTMVNMADIISAIYYGARVNVGYITCINPMVLVDQVYLAVHFVKLELPLGGARDL